MSRLAAGSGASGFLSVVSEVPVVSTRDAEGPEDCGSDVFIAEGVDGIGDKGSGDTTTVNVETLFDAFWRTSTLEIIFLNCQSISLWSISIQIKWILLHMKLCRGVK
jgi:hypothetical protein